MEGMDNLEINKTNIVLFLFYCKHTELKKYLILQLKKETKGLGVYSKKKDLQTCRRKVLNNFINNEDILELLVLQRNYFLNYPLHHSNR